MFDMNDCVTYTVLSIGLLIILLFTLSNLVALVDYNKTKQSTDQCTPSWNLVLWNTILFAVYTLSCLFIWIRKAQIKRHEQSLSILDRKQIKTLKCQVNWGIGLTCLLELSTWIATVATEPQQNECVTDLQLDFGVSWTEWLSVLVVTHFALAGLMLLVGVMSMLNCAFEGIINDLFPKPVHIDSITRNSNEPNEQNEPNERAIEVSSVQEAE